MGQKKAISPIIAIIIILLITIAIAGAGYSYLGTYWTSLTGKQIQVIDTFCVQTGHQGKVLIRNIGTSSIDTKDIRIINAQSGEDISQDVLWSTSVSDLDLVLELRFDEQSNPGIDTSGQGNDGTLFPVGLEPTWTSNGMTSGALKFNGDDYIDMGTNFESTFQGSFSISFWMKMDDGRPSSSQAPLGVTDGDLSDAVQYSIDYSGVSWFFYGANNNGEWAGVATPFSDGQQDWVHITLVADSTLNGVGGLKIYFDGEEQGMDPINNGDTSGITFGQLDLKRHYLYVGARNNGGTTSNYFTGIIDEVRIYNRALEPDEVKALAENSVTIEASETAYMTHTCTGRCRYNIILGVSDREASLEY